MRFDLDAAQRAFDSNFRGAIGRLPKSTDRQVAGLADEGLPRLPALARTLAEQGVFAIIVDEAAGGLGLGLTEALIAACLAGECQLGFPLCETIVAAAFAAIVQPQVAASIMAADTMATTAIQGSLAVVGHDGDGAIHLKGQVRAAYAAEAAWLVADIPGEQPSACLIDLSASGIAVRPAPSMDLSVRMAEVSVDATVPAAQIAAFDLRHPLSVLLAGEMLGAADDALRRGTAYIKERVQFGRAVGQNQALKHLAADSLLRVENMRLACQYAAASYDGCRVGQVDAVEARNAMHVAGAHAGVNSRQVIEDAIQMHGGIAFTWEFGLHLALRRVIRLANSLDPVSAHREHLARQLIDEGLADPACAGNHL